MRAESISTLAFSILLSCNASPSFHGSKIERKAEDVEGIPPSAEFLFTAGQTGHINMQATPERVVINQSLRFAALQVRSESFMQTNRELVQLEKMQGYDGSAVEETRQIKEEGPLDLLIVVDDSQSMELYQEMLSQRFEPLLSRIGNANWRVAVVTTTDNCQRDVITKEDFQQDRAGSLVRFANAVKAGIEGNAVERGIEMAIKGFTSKKCRNLPAPPMPWTRPDSEHVVLLVTDEENCGSASNDGCNADTGYPHYGVSEFLQQMPNTKVFGFLGYETNSCRGGFSKDPIEYRNLVDQTGGIWEKICQDDYAPVLSRVSEHVSRRIKKEIPLSKTPDAGTLQIFIAGERYTGPFEVVGNILKLKGNIQTSEEEILVKYEVGAKPRWIEFPVEDLPDMNTAKVYWDNELMNSDSYEFDPENKVFTFEQTPPDGVVVSVEYRRNDPLTEEFPLQEQPAVHTALVTVNGKNVNNFTYNQADNTIVFQKAPLDASLIEISYVRTTDLVLAYDAAPEDPSDVIDVAAKDNFTKEDLAVFYDGSSIFFDEEFVRPGNEVTVTYATSEAAIELQHHPLSEPVIQMSSTVAELCDFHNMITQQRKISLECARGTLDYVNIDYDYLINFQNTFTIDSYDLNYYDLKVFVNGEPFENYSLAGNTIVIPEADLTPWTQIKVALLRKDLAEAGN